MLSLSIKKTFNNIIFRSVCKLFIYVLDIGIQWALDARCSTDARFAVAVLSSETYEIHSSTELWPIPYVIRTITKCKMPLDIIMFWFLCFVCYSMQIADFLSHTNRFFMFGIWLIFQFCYRIKMESFYSEQQNSLIAILLLAIGFNIRFR